MTEPDFNSSTATRGKISLPDRSVMQYPIKITAVHTKAGTTFKAGTTTLYSAMDAAGKMLRYSHDGAGEVIRCHIALGDIVTEPKAAFDVWLFEVVQKNAEPKATITPTPQKETPQSVKTVNPTRSSAREARKKDALLRMQRTKPS